MDELKNRNTSLLTLADRYLGGRTDKHWRSSTFDPDNEPNDPTVSAKISLRLMKPIDSIPDILCQLKGYVLTPEQLAGRSDNEWGGKYNYPSFFKRTTNIARPAVPWLLPVLALDVESVEMECGCCGSKKKFPAKVGVVGWNEGTVVEEFVFDKHVYVTNWMGFDKAMLKENAKYTLEAIQNKILDLITKDTILIGHALHQDLNALQIAHDNVIDTSEVFKNSETGKPVKLKVLAEQYLDINIQANRQRHDPVIDANTCIKLMKHKLGRLAE